MGGKVIRVAGAWGGIRSLVFVALILAAVPFVFADLHVEINQKSLGGNDFYYDLDPGSENEIIIQGSGNLDEVSMFIENTPAQARGEKAEMFFKPLQEGLYTLNIMGLKDGQAVESRRIYLRVGSGARIPKDLLDSCSSIDDVGADGFFSYCADIYSCRAARSFMYQTDRDTRIKLGFISGRGAEAGLGEDDLAFVFDLSSDRFIAVGREGGSSTTYSLEDIRRVLYDDGFYPMHGGYPCLVFEHLYSSLHGGSYDIYACRNAFMDVGRDLSNNRSLDDAAERYYAVHEFCKDNIYGAVSLLQSALYDYYDGDSYASFRRLISLFYMYRDDYPLLASDALYLAIEVASYEGDCGAVADMHGLYKAYNSHYSIGSRDTSSAVASCNLGCDDCMLVPLVALPPPAFPCDGDGTCDPDENFLGCDDCAGASDGLCDARRDGTCDPDCRSSDPDCKAVCGDGKCRIGEKCPLDCAPKIREVHFMMKQYRLELMKQQGYSLENLTVIEENFYENYDSPDYVRLRLTTVYGKEKYALVRNVPKTDGRIILQCPYSPIGKKLELLDRENKSLLTLNVEGFSSYCGDGICQETESAFLCPLDCDSDLKEIDSYQDVLQPGEKDRRMILIPSLLLVVTALLFILIKRMVRPAI